jgi:60 kDa SS-A/Ro ribonucleoprotein
MRTNAPATHSERTHEGGLARTPTPMHQLLRQVSTCLLFERTYYSDGNTIAQEIADTCRRVEPREIARVAVLARTVLKLRHVPLFLLTQLDKRRAEAPAGLLAATVAEVVQRPDELSELLALIQKENDGKSLKKVLSAQVKKGLARAFRKFNAYQLGKWNRATAIKLRDVLFLCHPKPENDEQKVLWAQLASNTLPTPDTWEVALSGGANKREAWTRLLRERKLGYIALLMNLRNMEEAKVDRGLVSQALAAGAGKSKALPFRFVSAAKAAPGFAQDLSDAMLLAVDRSQPLRGKTFLLLDVSGSMDVPISAKATLHRWEAGAALGILLREVCDQCRVFTFSEQLVEVPNLRGLALLPGVRDSQAHRGTYLATATRTLFEKAGKPDRLIVVTDEQSGDGEGQLPEGVRGYVVNVAAERPALQLSRRWHRVSGFSERLVEWIRVEEMPESVDLAPAADLRDGDEGTEE